MRSPRCTRSPGPYDAPLKRSCLDSPFLEGFSLHLPHIGDDGNANNTPVDAHDWCHGERDTAAFLTSWPEAVAPPPPRHRVHHRQLASSRWRPGFRAASMSPHLVACDVSTSVACDQPLVNGRTPPVPGVQWPRVGSTSSAAMFEPIAPVDEVGDADAEGDCVQIMRRPRPPQLTPQSSVSSFDSIALAGIDTVPNEADLNDDVFHMNCSSDMRQSSANFAHVGADGGERRDAVSDDGVDGEYNSSDRFAFLGASHDSSGYASSPFHPDISPVSWVPASRSRSIGRAQSLPLYGCGAVMSPHHQQQLLRPPPPPFVCVASAMDVDDDVGAVMHHGLSAASYQ